MAAIRKTMRISGPFRASRKAELTMTRPPGGMARGQHLSPASICCLAADAPATPLRPVGTPEMTLTGEALALLAAVLFAASGTAVAKGVSERGGRGDNGALLSILITVVMAAAPLGRDARLRPPCRIARRACGRGVVVRRLGAPRGLSRAHAPLPVDRLCGGDPRLDADAPASVLLGAARRGHP